MDIQKLLRNFQKQQFNRRIKQCQIINVFNVLILGVVVVVLDCLVMGVVLVMLIKVFQAKCLVIIATTILLSQIMELANIAMVENMEDLKSGKKNKTKQENKTMSFTLFGIDYYLEDSIYGFWFGGLKTEDWHRALFAICCSGGEFFIDLFWIRILIK